MEHLATTDALTHLYNRHKMNELMEMEKIRFFREPRGFVIALADIDHFKMFNDKMGHDCGDYVLQQVSGLMKQSLRNQDMIARWGGEEFLILLPDTDLDGGILAIEKLRQEIAEHEFTFKDARFTVFLSFGLTVFDGTATIENCIQRADQALYTAKREGRNRVISTA
jgi:diguanylate cyclase (GGDEF)-like protein